MKDLSEEVQRFILHWGEMGTKWGINRTVAQVHALLFISEKPQNAEDIMKTLGVARSNVSTSLKELQNWGIVKAVHLPNDRRDHFESMKDVYEMFSVIASERKRREIDPTLSILRETVSELDKNNKSDASYAKERLDNLLEFFELSSDFYQKVNSLPTKTGVKLLRMGDRLMQVAGLLK